MPLPEPSVATVTLALAPSKTTVFKNPDKSKLSVIVKLPYSLTRLLVPLELFIQDFKDSIE